MTLKKIFTSLIIILISISASAQVGEKEKLALWESHIVNIIEGYEEAVVASAEDGFDFAAYFDVEVRESFGKTSAEQITDLVTENGQRLLVVISEPYIRTYFSEDENPEVGGKQKYVTAVTYRMDGNDFKLLRVQEAFLGGDEDFRKNITAAVGLYELEDTRMSQLRKIIGYMRDQDIKNIRGSSSLTDENWIEIGKSMMPDVNFKKIDIDETIKLICELLHDGIEQFYSERKMSLMYPRLNYSGRPLAEEQEEMYKEFQEQEHYRLRKEIKTITKVDGIDYYIRVRMTFAINSKERELKLVGIDGLPQEPMAGRETEERERRTRRYAAEEEGMGEYGEGTMDESEFRIKENDKDREYVWNTLIKVFEEKEFAESAVHFPIEWDVDFVNKDLDGFHYDGESEDIPFVSSEEFTPEMNKFLNCGVADHFGTLTLDDLDYGNRAVPTKLIEGWERQNEGEYSEEREEDEEYSEESEGGNEDSYSEEGEDLDTTPRYASYYLKGTFFVEKNIGFEENNYDLTMTLIEGEWKLTAMSLRVSWK